MVAWEATALPLGDTRLRAEDYRFQGEVCQDSRYWPARGIVPGRARCSSYVVSWSSKICNPILHINKVLSLYTSHRLRWGSCDPV